VSELRHDPLDFLMVLEVEPVYDEEAFRRDYCLEREGLSLVVSVFLAEPRAELTLRLSTQATPLLHFSFWVWDKARRVLDKHGESLEFLNCILGNINDNEHPKPGTSSTNIQLWIKPQIRLELH